MLMKESMYLKCMATYLYFIHMKFWMKYNYATRTDERRHYDEMHNKNEGHLFGSSLLAAFFVIDFFPYYDWFL